MPFKSHGRTYDLVVFGATGYTGVYLTEYITTSLPTDLKWALAGRSHDKLTALAANLKQLNPDRLQPAIETCGIDNAELAGLAKKTFVLITTVGPYGAYGEPAFKACAENGTHYLDVTGEVPFVARMVRKYEAAAKASGALMFPQSGVESAPADLVAWTVAKVNRTQLQAKTADVTAALRLKAMPSGGTYLTALTALDVFSVQELRTSLAPFALSPEKRDHPRRGRWTLLSWLTGLVTVRNLGLMTTSLMGATNASQVERTWGLLASMPARQAEAYGPRFSFVEYAKARNWFQGAVMHLTLAFASVLLAVCPPFRWLAKRFVYQPGEGPTREANKKDRFEYRAVGNPDLNAGPPRQQAFCRAAYNGGVYTMTGMLVAEAAMTLLEDDIKLNGGIYTPSFLGQSYIDRLDRAGLKFESKVIDA
ncbi:saccharopine dehydrogenase [Niveomyces insectorum RCEF 264]|uniref:Saccharopine dehydrogenase n=1 Tax=Niveomyces insectorum RCEF 264 TaxID=1081102 RepID=A0A162I9M9_9HYPO|nr:saccharopine dehydrogenase [Niveomyces insectorum RCEF 264]